MSRDLKSLVAHLANLLRREHAAMADFLVALADFDRQRGWRELGYAGLFPFLQRELGLSKAAAFFRMKAAELLQRYPEIVEPLRDGRLCITSVVELARVLTPDNRDAVLPRFFHCSKQEARAVAAELAPVQDPPRRAMVTAAPAERSILPALITRPGPETSSQSVRPGEPICLEMVSALPQPRPAPRDESVPLTATLNRLHVTVSRAFLDKLEGARLALSHKRPGATIEDVLEAGLDLVLEKDTRKRGLVAKPRHRPAKEPAATASEHIPASVRREVWKRDHGCCQWLVASGDICGSRLRPELDHIIPKARGGPSTTDNLRVLCRAHNDLAARLAYGADYMNGFRASRSPARPPQ
jgi:hypothetical protein